MDKNSLKQQLLETYKYKVELHAHTAPISPCSEISPEEMIKTYSALGFDVLAISNHFMITGEEKEAYINKFIENFEQTKALGEKVGINVLLAAEIRFTENQNDYLVYGVDRKILGEIFDLLPLGLENFRKNYDLSKGLIIQAHPFRNRMETVNADLIDGVEVYNMHPNHNSRIAIASLYAKNNGKTIITAGSDFHHPNQNHEGLGALRTKTKPKNSEELIEILKSGDYIFEIAGNNLIIP